MSKVFKKLSVGSDPVLQELTITENGEYTPDEGYDGLSKVIANVAGGGGGSADLVYVTFKTHDGAKELHKRAVVKGNTCMCPVTGAIKEIDTPTRESTELYRYIFGGWSTTANGALDESALEAITADKTVYAYFTAVTRFYTVNFYDGDTLLKKETLAYGVTPSALIPEKENYSFAGWSPELAAVTGDMNYYAQWSEIPTFAGSSWDTIIEIAKAGNAGDYFAIGDERTEVITYADGTTEEITWVVADYGKCAVKDADGNATTDNMTIVAKHALQTARIMHTDVSSYRRYTAVELNTFLSTEFFSALPASLQAGIMQYNLQYGNKYAPVWIPNWQQFETQSFDSTVYHYGSANILQLLSTANGRVRTLGKNGTDCEWWTATLSMNNAWASTVSEAGSGGNGRSLSVQCGVVPCFCI